jgi:hypothetical protein
MIVRAQGVTTEPIDQALGRSGQKTGEVYKLSFPRSDLHVSVHGLAIKPGLALGSWAAFLGDRRQGDGDGRPGAIAERSESRSGEIAILGL